MVGSRWILSSLSAGVRQNMTRYDSCDAAMMQRNDATRNATPRTRERNVIQTPKPGCKACEALDHSAWCLQLVFAMWTLWTLWNVVNAWSMLKCEPLAPICIPFAFHLQHDTFCNITTQDLLNSSLPVWACLSWLLWSRIFDSIRSNSPAHKINQNLWYKINDTVGPCFFQFLVSKLQESQFACNGTLRFGQLFVTICVFFLKIRCWLRTVKSICSKTWLLNAEKAVSWCMVWGCHLHRSSHATHSFGTQNRHGTQTQTDTASRFRMIFRELLKSSV